MKHIGASPLTGTIFLGKLNKERNHWIGKKEDVTDMVLSAALECMMVREETYTFKLKNGKKVTLNYIVEENNDR